MGKDYLQNDKDDDVVFDVDAIKLGFDELSEEINKKIRENDIKSYKSTIAAKEFIINI